MVPPGGTLGTPASYDLQLALRSGSRAVDPKDRMFEGIYWCDANANDERHAFGTKRYEQLEWVLTKGSITLAATTDA
jgi:hypothetical protein